MKYLPYFNKRVLSDVECFTLFNINVNLIFVSPNVLVDAIG